MVSGANCAEENDSAADSYQRTLWFVNDDVCRSGLRNTCCSDLRWDIWIALWSRISVYYGGVWKDIRLNEESAARFLILISASSAWVHKPNNESDMTLQRLRRLIWCIYGAVKIVLSGYILIVLYPEADFSGRFWLFFVTVCGSVFFPWLRNLHFVVSAGFLWVDGNVYVMNCQITAAWFRGCEPKMNPVWLTDE